MSDLTALDNLYLIVGFLAPGLIVLFVRSQFVTGRISPDLGAVPYVIVSVVYYALAYPFLEILLGIQQPGVGKAIGWFTLIFVGPAILGLVLGINIQKNLFRRLLQRCGLHLVHAIPTAWEWKFSAMPPQWVLVTLKDGTRFAGYCGPQSFISSDPAERDMYIEQIYDLDADHQMGQRRQEGGSNHLRRDPDNRVLALHRRGDAQCPEVMPRNEQRYAE